MNGAVTPSPSPSSRTLAMWHLLALGTDIAVAGAILVISFGAGLRFGYVPNLAVQTMGLALAAVSVTAAWLALGPRAASMRIVAAPLVCLAALSVSCLSLAVTGANATAVIGLFLAGIAQFLLLQVPYRLFSSWHRLQIVPLGEMVGRGPIERLQYSLWQLLVVMTMIAVALGIGRGIFALVGNSDGLPRFIVVLTSFFALLVGYNLLLAWPLIWAVLSPTRAVRRVVLAIVLSAFVVVVAYPLTSAILGSGEGRWIYFLVFAPQPAYLLAHLFATRASGYRLVQLV